MHITDKTKNRPFGNLRVFFVACCLNQDFQDDRIIRIKNRVNPQILSILIQTKIKGIFVVCKNTRFAKISATL
jgi:hypothetical protein